MEYQIVDCEGITELQGLVNSLIKEGWIPLGGITSTSEVVKVPHPMSGFETMDVVSNTFYQAMTRTAKPKATSRSLALLKTGAVVDAYNTYFRGKKVGFKLKVTARLETRLKICIEKEFKTITEWTNYFELIAMSDFLMGEIPPRNGYKQFKLSLDYIINETNIAKILEGNFNNE